MHMARVPMSRSERVQTRDNSSVNRDQSFPIVGIGASAGGLEAISELLRHIPERTGLAFVLIEHLDPSHRSNLSEILSRNAHIPVEEVREGTFVEPDHAYVIPPNVGMYIERGALHLAPRQPQVPNLPVDRFLSSLAAERQHRAIAVILSGTASDGAEGCKVIKEAGGITFAQTEASAKYSGMPQSAVDAGCVDFVLSPKEIAEKLVQIGAHPYVSTDMSPEEAVSYDYGDLGEVLNVVSDKTGFDFSQYKPTTLQRRIRRRMALHKLSDLKDYLRYVKETPNEAEDLYRDVLITVTDFFRDPDAFEVLKKNVFGPLLAERDPQSDLRIWVPGCATGEEPYSIAMALMEFISQMPHKKSLMAVHIFATDVNEMSLTKARAGIYSSASVKDLNPEQLHRFFVKQDGMYHVQKSIREMCVFAKQNVAKDPPFSNLDLISCRNLLIYFGEPLQMRVIPMFHYALRPGGYLMLGGSETLGKFADQFVVVDKKHKIFQKKKDSPRLLTYFINAGVISPEATLAAPVRAQLSSQSLERQFDKALLETFGPTSIVVTEEMEIVHLRGNTSEYLQPPSGQPAFNLNRMAREGLLVDLRTAVRNAKKSGKGVRRENLEVQSDRGPTRVCVDVHPFSPPGSREQYYIIGFQDVASPAHKAKRSGARRQTSRKGQQPADALRQELAHAKEQLKSLIEDHENTLEEYRSSSEEVLSSNEELQSLNEEMETAKEELQSTNEELRTVNEELQNRNAELVSANDDLTNLFSNVGIAALMVSNDLLVRRFTPQAQALLNLVPEDVGRRISELQPHLRDINLAEIARQTISSVAPNEQEIQAKDGAWYLMRVRPYNSSDQRIAGAVFVFQDIDLFKRSLDESRSYTATLIESARESIVVLDGSLRVINANNSFYKEFLVDPTETEGRFIYDLGSGQWKIPKLRTLLEDVLPAHSRVDGFEVHATFPQIGEKVMCLNARRIESQTGKKIILLAIEDVTELKQSERALRELSTRLLNIEDEQRRRIARDLHDVTGQKVAALALNVRLLAKHVPNAGSNRTVTETLELADKITSEIRGLSYVLHPPMLDELGLAPALREYVEGVSERTGLRIQLTVQEEFPRLEDEVAITIFRIIQECLTNVHRHSGSPEAKIELTHNGNEIQLRVADAGRGVNQGTDGAVNRPKKKLGVGIAGMEERVRHLRGTLEFLSNANGTAVIARMPIPKAHD
jgi:two-component system, chemotaxis family, CheB/CheR fusion protein